MKVIEGGFGKDPEACASELFIQLAAICKASEEEGVPVDGVGIIAVKGEIFEVGSNTATLEDTQVALAVGASLMLDIIKDQYMGEVE
tara:strand:- start:1332 stop:1592 length:261 start_codon:yes stop_codon:yes gene_type:complete